MTKHIICIPISWSLIFLLWIWPQDPSERFDPSVQCTAQRVLLWMRLNNQFIGHESDTLSMYKICRQVAELCGPWTRLKETNCPCLSGPITGVAPDHFNLERIHWAVQTILICSTPGVTCNLETNKQDQHTQHFEVHCNVEIHYNVHYKILEMRHLVRKHTSQEYRRCNVVSCIHSKPCNFVCVSLFPVQFGTFVNHSLRKSLRIIISLKELIQ